MAAHCTAVLMEVISGGVSTVNFSNNNPLHRYKKLVRTLSAIAALVGIPGAMKHPHTSSNSNSPAMIAVNPVRASANSQDVLSATATTQKPSYRDALLRQGCDRDLDAQAQTSTKKVAIQLHIHATFLNPLLALANGQQQ